MKVSFKTEKPTGKWAWTQSPFHYIKVDGVEVGVIVHNTWRIRLMVKKEDINEDGNPNCHWKWIQLKKENSTLDEAKNFVKNSMSIISEKYKFHNS